MKKFFYVLIFLFILSAFSFSFGYKSDVVKLRNFYSGNNDNELGVGVYKSSDNHTVTISEDGVILFDDTYTLVVNELETGSTISGSIGSNKKALSLKVINNSTLFLENAVSYKHNNVTTTLNSYTVFRLDSSVNVNSNGNFELIRNNIVVGSYLTLQDAVDSSLDGDVVKIKNDYKVNDGVYINKNITIDGNNSFIDRSSFNHIFIFVAEGTNVVLKNMIIDGGAEGFEVDYDAITGTNYTIPLKTDSDSNDPNLSSVIFSMGDLIISNVEFNNNYTSDNGAAIRVVSGSLNVENSKFNHNRSNRGGALHIYGSLSNTDTKYPIDDIMINNCEFNNNYSNGGGAIYLAQAKSITLNNSSFKDNIASGSYGGGAIIIQKQGASGYYSIAEKLGIDFVKLNVNNSIFEGNYSGNDGNAIESLDADIYIKSSKFINNVGSYPGTAVGTVSTKPTRVEYSDLVIEDSLFEGNYGGVAGVGDHAGTINAKIINTDFIKNYSTSTTLLLYSSQAVIEGCKFNENISISGVLALYSYYPITNTKFLPPVVDIKDVVFKDNVTASDIVMTKSTKKGAIETIADLTVNINGDYIGNRIDVWDGTKLNIIGDVKTDIYLDKLGVEENLTISEESNYEGNITFNPNTYTFRLYYPEDNLTLIRYMYLENDKVYNKKDFYMMHMIGKEDYELEYYTDASFTNLWDLGETAGIARVYANWKEHTHTYNGSLVLYNNAIHEQCECGYLGKKVSLGAPENVHYTGKKIEVGIKNEINLTGYTIKYQSINDNGEYVDMKSIPINKGKYRAILTYEDMSIEYEYSILEEVKNPNTSVEDIYLNFILLFVSMITFFLIIFKKKKYL